MTPLAQLHRQSTTHRAPSQPVVTQPTPEGEQALTDAERHSLAAQIIEAGKRRRGEVADETPLRTQAEILASRIIEAGRKRRGEIE